MTEAKSRGAARRDEDWVADSARALGPAVDKALLLIQRSTGVGRPRDDEETEELPRLRLSTARVL